MSTLYAYICVKSSADPFIPPVPINLISLGRDVSDALYALQGGYLRVGQIAFFPQQRSVPYHLLCDGKEVPKAEFPELYEFLIDTEGAPTDPANFVLPNFIGADALQQAPIAAAEVISGGTANSDTPEPGTGQSGGSEYPYVDLGSRYYFWGI